MRNVQRSLLTFTAIFTPQFGTVIGPGTSDSSPAFEQRKFADDRAGANPPRADERISLFEKIASYGKKNAYERW